MHCHQISVAMEQDGMSSVPFSFREKLRGRVLSSQIQVDINSRAFLTSHSGIDTSNVCQK